MIGLDCAPIKESRVPLATRLARKSIRSGDCINWTGGLNRRGYGYMEIHGRRVHAHRVAYEINIGPIPDGMQIDHLCMNKRCVNPAHLEAVTLQENVRRAHEALGMGAFKTHCPHGHAYSAENTILRRNGHRSCRECKRIADRIAQPKQSANRKLKRREQRESGLRRTA